MAISKIEWTESTWNPVTGCTKISAGCQNCYAERMAKRLKAMGQPNYANGFQVTMHEHVLVYPLKWKRSQLIFVNSMSDLFHEDVEDLFILKVCEIMRQANWHQFQILTKRASRLKQMSSEIDWPENVWIGVSVENNDVKYRIDELRSIQASVKFLSIEPFIGPLFSLDLDGIDWVIVGGESGPGAREMKEEWVINIKEECKKQNVPFFFKQWGGVKKKTTGRILQGRTWNELPFYISKFKNEKAQNDKSRQQNDWSMTDIEFAL